MGTSVVLVVVVGTDLSGCKPHRQVGIGKVVTLGSLGSVMVSALAQNAKDIGSSPTLSHFHHPCDTAYWLT